MDAAYATKVTVAQPGSGDSLSIPRFGAIYKIYSRDNGGEVAMVEHPFAVGLITAPRRHSREDETSIVLEGQIGFRSDDAEVVLGPGGDITQPRTQTHAELSELLAASEADVPAEPGARRHESDASAKLAEKPPDLRNPAVARRRGGPLRPEPANPLPGN
jgi:quercetin dioxygenase-like cupin family protein